ncbi:MAG: alpha/beta hydrolase [Oscillospiraceae bacterium]|jgi:acetyl esterase/lipase|nr:alpha/beta hydrolase [Oscillospiraceae bacterium]
MTIKTFFLNNERTAYVRAFVLSRIEEIPWTHARPAVVIFPGGGYEYCSDKEAEPLAMRYVAEGFNAFILNYTCGKKYPAAFTNAAYAMFKIKARADEFGIDKDKIAVVGASAGGHLAGCLATMWSDTGIVRVIGCEPDDIKPSAAVLCYPVISGVTSPHKSSFAILAGDDANQATLSRLSLENRVTPKTPPIFLWCTADDSSVSAHNSIVMAKACVSNNVPVEMHMYDSGPHGLSDCSKGAGANEKYFNNPCAGWIDLSVKFLRKYLDL